MTDLATGRKWGLADDQEWKLIKLQRPGVRSQAQPQTHPAGSAGPSPACWFSAPSPPKWGAAVDLESRAERPEAA